MAFTETLQHVAASFVGLTGSGTSQGGSSFLTKIFSADAKMSEFVNTLFFSAVSVGAMLAVLQIARAGALYMGSDAWGQKDKAKHLMQDAVIGLLLLLAIVLILRQINPQLLNLEVLNRIEKLPPAQGG